MTVFPLVKPVVPCVVARTVTTSRIQPSSLDRTFVAVHAMAVQLVTVFAKHPAVIAAISADVQAVKIVSMPIQ